MELDNDQEVKYSISLRTESTLPQCAVCSSSH